ncbi:unnamed protein product [Dibothriocephalus latus]|uniref:Uncharacterized protein n=1 Tax=Dibothriocephalus latus TaxID=60516 RepID=A0A3P7P570_DIBLA|nr:unnamed protein product [Dibothriocephalus latus]
MLVTRQITGNLKEYFLPYGETRMRQAWLSARFDKKIGAEHTPRSGKIDKSTVSEFVKAISARVAEKCTMDDTDVRHRNEADPSASKQ